MRAHSRASAIGALVVLLASCKATQPPRSTAAEALSTPSEREAFAAAEPYRQRTLLTAAGAPSPALALAVSRGTAGHSDPPPSPEPPTQKPPAEIGESNSDRASAPATGQVLRVRTTAYCSDEHDHFTFGTMSALGTPLQSTGPVRSAAADWSEFPAGTTFRLAGHPEVFRVDDYGSALVGTRTIDLFFPNPIAMDEWGARKVDIEILKWGSRARSLKILRPRSGHEHIDRMIRGLESSQGR